MTAPMTDAEREARRRWAAQTERAWMAADAAERKEAQAEADRLWNAIVGFEMARAGVALPGPRPTELGE